MLKTACGTPPYMSPELCKKVQYDGMSADMWAIGVLFYTIMFGIHPFKANSEPELMKKIVKGEF